MRLRTLLGSLLATALLMVFLVSDAQAQRRGRVGGYRGGAVHAPAGHWGGYRGYDHRYYPRIYGGLGYWPYLYSYPYTYTYPNYAYYPYSYTYAYPSYDYFPYVDYTYPSTSYYYSEPSVTYVAPSTTSSYSTPPAPAPTATETIFNNSFHPTRMDVSPGTTVTWTNRGNSPHTVTSSSGLWDSGTLQPGMSFGYAFTQPGTYDYYDRFNPNVHGEIIVR
jgi:plastocyanin